MKLKGITNIDRFDGELTIFGSVTESARLRILPPDAQDSSAVKRVELHCHTKMSDMDGVSDVKDIIKQGKGMGHARPLPSPITAAYRRFRTRSIHFSGNAFETIKTDPFKVIYGVEGYLVDDLEGGRCPLRRIKSLR